MPLPVTQALANFQGPTPNRFNTSASPTGSLGAGPFRPEDHMALPASSPLMQDKAAETRQAAMRTLGDPAFWRARMLNRMGVQSHDDPAVNHYLTQFQSNPQGGLPAPGALLGAGLLGAGLAGALGPTGAPGGAR